MIGEPIGSATISYLRIWSGYIYVQATLTATERAAGIFAATFPFISRATDTPSNMPFAGTLENGLRIDRSITNSSGGYGGYASNLAELTLINSDGLYDDLAGAISINGQDVHVTIGETSSQLVVVPFNQFIPIANLVGERFQIDRTRVTIELRDPGLVLSTKTVQQDVYAGTGGVEGGNEIAGRRRPYVQGIVFNATPTLVIAGELLFQINDGPVDSIVVKDGGIELMFSTDYPNVATLRANPPNAGEYSTSEADGYFILGGANAKTITCDVIGTLTTTSEIIEDVITTIGGLTASNIDQDSFDVVLADQPAQIGYFLDSNSSETIQEMVMKLMTGIGGWYGITALGIHYIRRFEEPTESTTFFYHTHGRGLLNIDRTKLPDDLDPPPQRRRAIYGRNWTVMSSGDIVAGLFEDDPAAADRLQKPYNLASTGDAESALVLAKYPNAPDPEPVESYFALEVDAMSEAERLFELYNANRQAYAFTIKNALFLHEIGDIVNVTDTRLGLNNGKYLRLVGVVDDCNSMSTEAIGFG